MGADTDSAENHGTLLCPLKRAGDVVMPSCDREYCAWWHHHESRFGGTVSQCAILTLAVELRYWTEEKV